MQIKKWNELAGDEAINKTVKALEQNGITATVVDNGNEAKEKILAMIPKGAQVMNMSSVTLETIGLVDIFNKSGDYDSVKNKLNAMNRETQHREMQQLGASPEWAVGSVHAVTEDGHVFIASNTGSQLPAYVYSAGHVVWVVGTQKIVKDFDAAMKRIYDYVVPLEDKHMHQLHGVGTNVSKLLIFNKEIRQNRVALIFVKEVLGF